MFLNIFNIYIYIYKYDYDEAINHVNYMKYEPCFHKANLTHPMSSHHPISIPLPPANALPRKDVRHGDGKSQPQINDANDSQVFAQLICILILCIYIYMSQYNILYTIYIYTWMCHFWGLLDCVNGLHHLTPPSTSLVSMPICAGPIRLGTPL